MCVCRKTERSAEDWARLVSRLLLAESLLADAELAAGDEHADELNVNELPGDRMETEAEAVAATPLSRTAAAVEAESANSRERLRHDLQTALALSGSALRRFPGDAQLTRLRAHAFRALGIQYTEYQKRALDLYVLSTLHRTIGQVDWKTGSPPPSHVFR